MPMRSNLSPSRSATTRVVGAAGALPPRGIGDTRAAQGGPGADQAGSLQVAQVVAHAGLHFLFARPRRSIVDCSSFAGARKFTGRQTLPQSSSRASFEQLGDLVVYPVEDVPNQSIFVDESDTSESLAAFDAGQGRNQAAKCRRQIADRPARIHRSSVMHTASLTLAPGPRSL